MENILKTKKGSYKHILYGLFVSYIVCNILLDSSFHLSLFSMVLLKWFMLWFISSLVLRSSDLFLGCVEYKIVVYFFLILYQRPRCLPIIREFFLTSNYKRNWMQIYTHCDAMIIKRVETGTLRY